MTESRRVALLWGLAIFLCALAVRLVCVAQFAPVPFFNCPISDGRSYWDWAGQIASGGWLGQEVFYQAPLYPYFVAAIRLLCGPHVPVIYVVQAVLNSGACVLTYLAGRRLFSCAAGIVAGFMLAFYAPAIFFDGVLQKEALALFLMAALLYLLVVSTQQQEDGTTPAGWKIPTARNLSLWLSLGAVVSLLSLVRENALTMIPVLVAWVLVTPRTLQLRWRAAIATAVMGGVLLILLPVGLRNLAVGGEFALTTAQMGPNFYIGNGPEADGTYVPLRPGRGNPRFERQDATMLAEKALGRKLTPGEVSRYWMSRTCAFIRANPGRWLRLVGKKVLLVANAYEMPDAEDYYFYQEWAWLLRALGSVWHFGVLLPLAAAGVCLTWRQRRELGIFFALALALAGSIVIFYIFARYRLPLVPILTLVAGGGAVEAVTAVRRHQWRTLAIAGIVAIATALVANISVYPRWAKAAGSYFNWGYLLAESGAVEAAMEKYRFALKLNPSLAEAHFNLGNLLARRGQLSEAIVAYREAIRARACYPEAWNNLGIALARANRWREAAEAFWETLQIEPTHPYAVGNLRRLATAARERGEAHLADEIEARLQRELP